MPRRVEGNGREGRMRKIVSLFQRNYDGDHLVRNEVVPGAEWVIAGEGIATEKMDGTCCMMRGGKLFKRFDAKRGKTPPPGFEPAQDPDPVTFHWPGWVPVGDGPEDKWHRDAFHPDFEDGTFELIGPKVGGNPHKANNHFLVRHGATQLGGVPRGYSGLKEYFETANIEGIVWHHPDGRMVKIKRKDFGLPWPCPPHVPGG